RGGVVTSSSRVHRTPANRGSSPSVSIAAASASGPPPGGRGLPSASRTAPPSAVTIPDPPSVVAEPPRQTVRARMPWFRQSRISWPVPRVDAARASFTSATAGRPEAEARSRTARPSPRFHQAAVAGRPTASATVTSWRAAEGEASASSSAVPSPPSAIGATTGSAPASRTPTAIASAASRAVAVPLKLSGQYRTRKSAAPLPPPSCEVSLTRMPAIVFDCLVLPEETDGLARAFSARLARVEAEGRITSHSVNVSDAPTDDQLLEQWERENPGEPVGERTMRRYSLELDGVAGSLNF